MAFRASISAPGAARAGLAARALAVVPRGGAGTVFVLQGCSAGLAYAQQVILARLLGASGFGLYTYLWLYAGWGALLAGLGLPAAAVRFLPAYRSAGREDLVSGFVGVASRWTWLTASAGAAVLATLALAVAGLGAARDPWPFVLCAVTLPALAGSILYSELARAGSRMTLAFAGPLLARPALIAFGALAVGAAGGLSPTGALALSAAAAYVVVLAQRRRTLRPFERPEPAAVSRAQRGEWLGVGASMLAAGMFVIVLMQLDIVVVAAIRGARDAGLYAAASRTAALVSLVIVAVNSAAAPRFAALWAQERRSDLQLLVRRLAGAIFWPSLTLALAIALLAGPLLSLFGAGFVAARPALLVLLAGQLVNAAAGPVGYLLTTTGHHRRAAVWIGVCAALCLVLATLGTLAWGMVGAAAGSAVGLSAWNLVLLLVCRRRVGIWASVFSLPVREARVDG